MEQFLVLLGSFIILLLLVDLFLTWKNRRDLGRLAGGNLQQALGEFQERIGRALREELAAGREESARRNAELRSEVQAAIQNLAQSVVTAVSDISKAQEARISGFSTQLTQANDSFLTSANSLREEVSKRLKEFSDSMIDSFAKIGELQKGQLDSFSQDLRKLTETIEQKFEALQSKVDQKLGQIQQDNERKLEEMRRTVDEKLQGTLEKRLGESFNTVSKQLQQVFEGLGEMRKLATGVGDLKKVLTNVKTRGTWGEVTAENLLDQILSPEQWERNVSTKPGSSERVDFAIKLPGRSGEESEVVWLPIDAKFPKEAYERLMEASEANDSRGFEEAGKELEREVRLCARSISDKYLNPPKTTDFGIMFLASEGLYAEVVRRVGIVELIQRKYRIVIAGPSNLAALLNSLQMGFKTLAIEQRSSEVWKTLSAVKNEFAKFGDVLQSVKKTLDQASRKIDQAEVRTRAIHRKLRDVEVLPESELPPLLESKQKEKPSIGEIDADIQ